MILDEATSALDTANEAMIQAALKNLLRGRTAFVIAHRLVTVVDSDLIVVMDGGLIVERGSHPELVARPDGLYAQLCRSQFDAPPAPVVPPPTPRKPFPGAAPRPRSISSRDRKQWT